MKNKLFTTLVLAFSMLFLSNVANAGLSQVSCTPDYNRIDYTYDSYYNHVWVYVNGGYRGDFNTISGGLGNYSTNLNSGDHIMLLWFNLSEGYNQSYADC